MIEIIELVIKEIQLNVRKVWLDQLRFHKFVKKVQRFIAFTEQTNCAQKELRRYLI